MALSRQEDGEEKMAVSQAAIAIVRYPFASSDRSLRGKTGCGVWKIWQLCWLNLRPACFCRSAKLKRGAGDRLRGHLQPDMSGPNAFQAFSHNLRRKFRAIAFLAKMPQVQVPHIGRYDLLDGIRRRFVGKVPVPAEDSLFQAPGAVRTVLQHLNIVIRFQDQDVRAPHPFKRQARRMTEVRQHTDIAGSRFEQKPDRVLSIVGHGERIHHHVAQFKRRARLEQPAFHWYFTFPAEGVAGQAVAVHRHIELLTQHGEPGDMVRVFVGNQDSREVLRRLADGCQAVADLAQAEPGVDQNARFRGLKIGTIAARTAAKNRQAYAHGG